MPFRLAPLKKRVAPAREPWKAVLCSETTLPKVKGVEAHDIGTWVPSPKTSNEEALPEIQQIADRIASRYAGGLSKLNEVQRAWRQKHEKLHRKRGGPGSDNEEPILSPSCRDDSSPPRDTSRDSLQPSLSMASSRRSNSGSPRRRNRSKKHWSRKSQDVTDEPDEVPEVEDKETRIKDVLKSGLGDLFHQKREVYHGEEPAELQELQSRERSVLRRSESWRSQGFSPRLEDVDARFARGTSNGASDNDAASMPTSSFTMDEFRTVKRPRESMARKSIMPPSLGSKKTPLRLPRQLEPSPKDDGERHGRQLSFATCSELAKKHKFTVPIVRHALEEFLSLDKNGDGRLSLDEFEQAIRDRCNIAPDEATPTHLLHLNWSKADKDNDHEINFEEFLVWSTNHLFTEELVVNDPQERYMRELARKFNLRLDQVEKCYKTFMNSDSNRNGFIEEGEFRSCVAVLWNCDMEDIPATRFRQFWLEADKGRLGKLSFEVFLIWYMTIGVR